MPTRDACTDSLLQPSTSALQRLPSSSSSMPFFNASATAFFPSERPRTSDDHPRWYQTSSLAARRKSRALASLHRTLSSPSPSSSFYRTSRSSRRPSRSLTCPSRESYSSYRSLRSSSPSRVSFFSPRRTLRKVSRLNQNISASYDSCFKSQQSDLSSQHSIRLISSQNLSENNLNENLDDSHCISNYSQNSLPASGNNNSHVERSISSPGGLQPSGYPNSLSSHSPSSAGRLRYCYSIRSQEHIVQRSPNAPMATILPSPSISLSEDLSQSFQERDSNYTNSVQRIFGSIDSSLNSSRNSLREVGSENEQQTNAPNEHSTFLDRHVENQSASTIDGPSFWTGERSMGVSLRLQGGASEERQRLSQLALAHLTPRDLASVQFQSPPPSYEKLCNPEALPTYKEATESRRGEKIFQEQAMIFTLPSVSDFSGASHTDPLLQDTDRNLRGGLMASIAADLSDSEGGYTTILDAIPHHHTGDSYPEVPIRFVPRCSLQRLRSSKIFPICLSSVCNKDLVKKELNRRWPFIISAREDDRCPGLMLVECSSNLAVAQIPDYQPSHENTASNRGNAIADIPDYENAPLETTNLSTHHLSSFDIDSAALNSQVMFYLCGKCVNYDSFDVDSIRTHIEYDCSGTVNKWANMSELYLVMRALCFVLVIILVLTWLPLGRW